MLNPKYIGFALTVILCLGGIIVLRGGCKPFSKVIAKEVLGAVDELVTNGLTKSKTKSLTDLLKLSSDPSGTITLTQSSKVAALMADESATVIEALIKKLPHRERATFRLHVMQVDPEVSYAVELLANRIYPQYPATFDPSITRVVDDVTYKGLTDIARRANVNPKVLAMDLAIVPDSETIARNVVSEVQDRFPSDIVKSTRHATWNWTSRWHSLYDRPVSRQKVIALLPADGNGDAFRMVFGHTPSAAEQEQMAELQTGLRGYGAVFVASEDQLKQEVSKTSGNTVIVVIGHSLAVDGRRSRNLLLPDAAQKSEGDIVLWGALRGRPSIVLTCYGEQLGLGSNLRFNDALAMIATSQATLDTGRATASQLQTAMLSTRSSLQKQRVVEIGMTTVFVGSAGAAVVTIAPKLRPQPCEGTVERYRGQSTTPLQGSSD